MCALCIGGPLSSTEVLDLVKRQITSGGELATARKNFHFGKIISGGGEKMFALGGRAGHYGTIKLNTVEEWVEESSTWKAADNFDGERAEFGLVSVPRQLICPV